MQVKQLLHFMHTKTSRLLKNKYKLKKIYYPEALWSWCGVDFINTIKINQKNKLLKKYTVAKGELKKIHHINGHTIAYDDHVSRIRMPHGINLGTAQFHKPHLSASDYLINNINDIKLSESCATILSKYPQLSSVSNAFNYQEMEKVTHKPICVGLPDSLGKDFILNQNNLIKENVLHLPIKITESKAIELKQEKRTLPDHKTWIRFDHLYIPDELKSLYPLISYICEIEMVCNSKFMSDCYLFLSISNSTVYKGTTQRRGGWHIDGHQGFERMNLFGEKLPYDRQYLISNVLPTETITGQFNFDVVRQYCVDHGLLIDDVNMQDVIEYYASKMEDDNPHNVVSCMANQLYFLNPYMVHRAATNIGNDINRTFVRIICSTYPRDRLGDSVNPILGPIYPMKIKTITDIHEIDLTYLRNS